MVQIADQRAEAVPMRIRGIELLAPDEMDRELAAGGRFVFFEYTISLVFVTLRRPTDIYFLRAGEKAFPRSIPYCLLSLFLGWWGLPWGIIYTPLTLILNFSGGRDVTQEVRELVRQTANASLELRSAT
jgi:hypothetical protein